MGRGFLQNFQQGVLRLLGHIVGPDEQNGAAGRLIGQDIGVLPHGPHGVDMKGPGRPVPAHLDDIRVAAGRGLDAAGADAARLVPRPLADGRFGQQAGQGAPGRSPAGPPARGRGETAGVDIGGQLPLGRLVARKAFKSHPYSFSYRSMSVTKTVAPPTVTSTGKEA